MQPRKIGQPHKGWKKAARKTHESGARTQADREVDWATGRELERKDSEIDRLKAALKAAREFVAGMVKPVTMPTMLTISSYHPCHALLDKIDAALGSTGEQSPGGKDNV